MEIHYLYRPIHHLRRHQDSFDKIFSNFSVFSLLTFKPINILVSIAPLFTKQHKHPPFVLFCFIRNISAQSKQKKTSNCILQQP